MVRVCVSRVDVDLTFSRFENDALRRFVFEVVNDESEVGGIGLDMDDGGLAHFRASSHDLIEWEGFVRCVDPMFVSMSTENHLATGVDQCLHPELLAKPGIAAVTGWACAVVVTFKAA